MEIREIKGLFVSVFTDDLMPFSYIKVLTETSLETVKISARFTESKFSHYFSPYNLLSIEVIKTRKNWIVRDVIVLESIVKNPSFNHIIKHVQMLKLLADNITEGQDIQILDWFITQIKDANSDIGMELFQKELDQKLNFKMY